jgi:hypothetical protein
MFYYKRRLDGVETIGMTSHLLASSVSIKQVPTLKSCPSFSRPESLFNLAMNMLKSTIRGFLMGVLAQPFALTARDLVQAIPQLSFSDCPASMESNITSTNCNEVTLYSNQTYNCTGDRSSCSPVRVSITI